MSEAVVDPLEAGQVQEEHSTVGFVPLRTIHRLRQPVMKQDPIRQSGQGIVSRYVLELTSRALDGGNVGTSHDVVRGNLVGRVGRLDGNPQRTGICVRVRPLHFPAPNSILLQ